MLVLLTSFGCLGPWYKSLFAQPLAEILAWKVREVMGRD